MGEENCKGESAAITEAEEGVEEIFLLESLVFLRGATTLVALAASAAAAAAASSFLAES